MISLRFLSIEHSSLYTLPGWTHTLSSYLWHKCCLPPRYISSRHFYRDVCPTSYVAKAVNVSSSLILKWYLLSVSFILIDGTTLPSPTSNQSSCPRNFFLLNIFIPISSFHLNYLSTTYPSIHPLLSILSTYLSVPVYFKVITSLLIIFPVVSVFFLNLFFTELSELHI